MQLVSWWEIVVWFLKFICLYHLKTSQQLESTDAAPRSPYRSLTWRPASNAATFPFFFLIHTDSARFAPIRAKTGWFKQKRELRWPKWPPKHADTTNSGRNSRWNEQRLPFFCFMWPCEREKKKKRRKKKMRRHKKMDGRRIKVCNKRK